MKTNNGWYKWNERFKMISAHTHMGTKTYHSINRLLIWGWEHFLIIYIEITVNNGCNAVNLRLTVYIWVNQQKNWYYTHTKRSTALTLYFEFQFILLSNIYFFFSTLDIVASFTLLIPSLYLSILLWTINTKSNVHNLFYLVKLFSVKFEIMGK